MYPCVRYRRSRAWTGPELASIRAVRVNLRFLGFRSVDPSHVVAHIIVSSHPEYVFYDGFWFRPPRSPVGIRGFRVDVVDLCAFLGVIGRPLQVGFVLEPFSLRDPLSHLRPQLFLQIG